jgi:hypothetical protein
MGGQTQQNTQHATTTNPWAPASGAVQNLLGQLGSINPNLTGAQTGAINQLTALVPLHSDYDSLVWATRTEAGCG